LEANEQWIADKLEGRVVLETGGIEITEHNNKLDEMLPPSLVGKHAKAESGGKIVFAPGVKITIEHPEVYIFSAAKGDLATLKQAMCESAAEPYDACIRILDFQHLAHRLFHRGKVASLNNARMSQLFVNFDATEVRYDNLLRGQDSGQAPEASPFLKHVYFSNQREIRIAFFPRRPIALETLIVQIPRPDHLFTEVFRKHIVAEPPAESATLTPS
jgi:hypothetical protein